MHEKMAINKLENIIDWIITIIFTIVLFLAIFFSAMDFANAEEYELQPFDNYFYNYIDTTYNITGSQEIFNSFTDVPTDTWQYVEVSNSSNILGFIYNDNRLDVSNFSVTSNAYNTNELRYVTWDGKSAMCSTYNLDYTNVICYIINYKIGGYGTRIYKVNFGTKSYLNGSSNPYTKCSVTRTTLYTYNWQSYNSESVYGIFNLTNTLKFYNYRPTFGYCDTPYGWWTAIGTGNKGTHIELEHMPDKSTNGFNVFIYNDLGIDYVRFVPNGLVTVGSHYSNNPTISFDMILNNDVTIPVTYDESAGYYFESIEYGKAYYEIPVVELLPSSIADFDNIYITNVIYTNEWSTVGDSGIDKFYYVDKCWLKRTYNNEEIGQVSVPYESTDTGYSQQEITDIYNMITNASTLEGTFDVEKNLSGGSSYPISFSSFQDAVVDTIECYHVTGTKTSDWSHIEIDYPPISVDSGNNMYWLNYNGNTTGSFNSRYSYYCSPYSYVRENNYSGYYDIIYFIVHEMVYDESGNIAQYSDLSTSYTKYYYFISYRYYNKLILYREMDILEYLKLGNEGQEKIYDYLFYKINNIDDNMYYFFKDKLNIDNDIVDKIKEIDNSITLSTDSIMDLLNRILDALLDINIEPVEPLDITPITTRLDLILEKQTNSNLNNDWYKNFRQWLYEETDNNLLDTPHEWFIDKLPSIKSLYNIFGGHDTTFYYTPMMNVIDGYIHGQDLLNDETTYSTFYYKGTWSSGFNTSNFDSYHISNNNEVQ